MKMKMKTRSTAETTSKLRKPGLVSPGPGGTATAVPATVPGMERKDYIFLNTKGDCLLCSEKCSPCDSIEKRQADLQTSVKFCRLASRYLGFNLENVVVSTLKTVGMKGKSPRDFDLEVDYANRNKREQQIAFELCDRCLSIAHDFCEVHFQLQFQQMLLDRCVRTLTEVIGDADKKTNETLFSLGGDAKTARSQQKTFTRLTAGGMKSASNLRAKLYKKSLAKLSCAFPVIKLKRICKSGDWMKIINNKNGVKLETIKLKGNTTSITKLPHPPPPPRIPPNTSSEAGAVFLASLLECIISLWIVLSLSFIPTTTDDQHKKKKLTVNNNSNNDRIQTRRQSAASKQQIQQQTRTINSRSSTSTLVADELVIQIQVKEPLKPLLEAKVNKATNMPFIIAQSEKLPLPPPPPPPQLPPAEVQNNHVHSKKPCQMENVSKVQNHSKSPRSHTNNTSQSHQQPRVTESVQKHLNPALKTWTPNSTATPMAMTPSTLTFTPTSTSAAVTQSQSQHSVGQPQPSHHYNHNHSSATPTKYHHNYHQLPNNYNSAYNNQSADHSSSHIYPSTSTSTSTPTSSQPHHHHHQHSEHYNTNTASNYNYNYNYTTYNNYGANVNGTQLSAWSNHNHNHGSYQHQQQQSSTSTDYYSHLHPPTAPYTPMSPSSTSTHGTGTGYSSQTPPALTGNDYYSNYQNKSDFYGGNSYHHGNWTQSVSGSTGYNYNSANYHYGTSSSEVNHHHNNHNAAATEFSESGYEKSYQDISNCRRADFEFESSGGGGYNVDLQIHHGNDFQSSMEVEMDAANTSDSSLTNTASLTKEPSLTYDEEPQLMDVEVEAEADYGNGPPSPPNGATFPEIHWRQSVASGPKIPCTLPGCSEQFLTNAQLELHLRAHGSFQCHFCHLKFGKAHKLAMHEKTRHSTSQATNLPPGRIKCPRCEFTSTSQYKFLLHFISGHLHIPVWDKPCEICNKQFVYGTKAINRRNHFKGYHDVEGRHPEDIFSCKGCHAPFLKECQWRDHQTWCAPRAASTPASSCASSVEEAEAEITYTTALATADQIVLS